MTVLAYALLALGMALELYAVLESGSQAGYHALVGGVLLLAAIIEIYRLEQCRRQATPPNSSR